MLTFKLTRHIPTPSSEAHQQTGQFAVTPVSGVLEYPVGPYRQSLQISFTARYETLL